MKRARLQEDAQAYEAQISQAYTPIVAPPSQSINQSPVMSASVAPPQSIVSQSAGNPTAPPPPMVSQSPVMPPTGSARSILCCDDTGYDVASSHTSYDQPGSSVHKYNTPSTLKVQQQQQHHHHHPPPPLDDPLPPPPPPSSHKYNLPPPHQQKYDVPPPTSTTTHEYDPLPPQVPVAGDEEPTLVYPSMGTGPLTDPTPMADASLTSGYFPHYTLDPQPSLDTQDPLDYSVLEALFDSSSYPPSADVGTPDNYHDYHHY
ncbi:hypothetical protein OTU49_015011 [Cherax quadricarinatus]|uniref:Uncharacterized protein n=1 Tax=Cherax quadricarinatus TaxID=27406 RepID=A0AAW0YKY4_CHEQU